MTPHRFYASIILSTTFAACSQASRVDLTAEQQAVIAASDSVVAQEMAKNTEGALAYFTSAAVVQMEGMPEIVGKDGLRRIYNAMFADTAMLGFTSTRTAMEVAPGGRLAWEHGQNHFHMKGSDGPIDVQGKYLAVWSRQAGGWKIAAIAVTNDAPAAVH